MTNLPQSHFTILHVASGDLWAGAEAQIYYMCQQLQQVNNIDLQVVLLNNLSLAEKLRTHGITVHIFDENRLNAIQILNRLVHLIREKRPDIIHTHRQKENVLGSIAALLSSNTTCLRTQHGDEEHFPKFYQLHKFAFKLLDRLAGRYLQRSIVAVSQELAEKLTVIYKSEKVVCIPNGINIEEIQQRALAFTPELPGPPDNTKIAVFARLVPVKRIDIAVESIHALSDPNISLYIFGDGPLKQDICDLVSRRNLENQIFLMGHQDNIYPFMRAMDYCLITSAHEGLPMNLLEAMSLETVVVAHAVGGIPYALAHGQAGVLVEDNIAENYSQVMRNLLQHPEKTSNIKQAALQRVNQYYSSAVCAQNTLDLYQKLVDSKQ